MHWFGAVPLSAGVRVCPGSTAAPLRGALSWSGALKRFAVSFRSFGVRLQCSARTHPNPDLISRSIRGRGWGEAPRKNQAALSGANKSGAVCEDCLSPGFFAQQKMVEFRSSHFCLRSYGPFEGLLPSRDRLRWLQTFPFSNDGLPQLRSQDTRIPADSGTAYKCTFPLKNNNLRK